MRLVHVLSSIVIALSLLACSHPEEAFIGTWSNNGNNEDSRGGMHIIVQRDGDKLLVKQVFLKQNPSGSDALVSVQNGRIEDGCLIVEGGLTGYKKYFHSKTDDAIIPVGINPPVILKRLAEKSIFEGIDPKAGSPVTK